MALLKQALFWAGIAAGTAPIWGALLWEIWDGGVRPRFVARGEIDALAARLLARHGSQAERMAFIEEDRAWRYSDSFEERKWRRVRRHIAAMRAGSTARV